MACRSCVDFEGPGWDPFWDMEACVGGNIYGPCSSEQCGGVCSYVCPCDCECHNKPPDITDSQGGAS